MILRRACWTPFSRDVARDGDVLALARDLVDLVDIDDAALGGPDVASGVLDQLEKDVLDVLADVARLGQRGSVRHRERDLELLGEGLRQQGLPGARRPDEEDVRFLDLDFRLGLALVGNALVMVVDGHREGLFHVVLPDDVLVEIVLDLPRLGDLADEARGQVGFVLGKYLLANLDALVADVYPGPRDDPPARIPRSSRRRSRCVPPTSYFASASPCFLRSRRRSTSP